MVDVSILAACPHLEVLSLSLNRVHDLSVFAGLRCLRELYLRRNDVAAVANVSHLAGLPRLETLWLADNPCAEQPNYREAVASILPRLRILDGRIVERTPPRPPAPPPPSPPSSPVRERRPWARPPPLQEGGAVPGASGRVPPPSSLGRASSRPDFAFASVLSDPSGSPGRQGSPGRSRTSGRDLGGGSYAERPRSAGGGMGSSTSLNVLYAAVALMRDLDADGLRVIRQEADLRLRQLGRGG